MADASSRSGLTVNPAQSHAALREQLEELRSDRLGQLVDVSEAPVGEDELNAPRAADLRRVVAEIDAALGRLDDGSYGKCERCAASIPVERLEIVPYARYCVACQQSGERRRA